MFTLMMAPQTQRLPPRLLTNKSVDRKEHSSRRNSLPSYKLQCFSVACLDMPCLEFGDKVVLPPKILRELQFAKVPTPLLFMVQAVGLDMQQEEAADTCKRQYCSVQEFSAPNGQAFLPYWLMEALHVPEGGSVIITSVVNLPRGIYCRFQPETMRFLDLAADVGPKLLMETALRRYSVLSVNSTIVIEYGIERFYVRVAELKPASVVSLCGDVDLETDFMPPEGFDLKRPSTGKKTVEECATPESSCSFDRKVELPDTSLTSTTSYGRRLRDGGYVESAFDVYASTSRKASHQTTLCNLQKALNIVHNKASQKTISTESIAAVSNSSILAARLRSAQRAFSTPSFALGTALRSPFIEQHSSVVRDTVTQVTVSSDPHSVISSNQL